MTTAQFLDRCRSKRLIPELPCVALPESSRGGCAWPEPAGPHAGCAPGRSSELPPCSAAAASASLPPVRRPPGPSWSTCGGPGRTAPGPASTEPRAIGLVQQLVQLMVTEPLSVSHRQWLHLKPKAVALMPLSLTAHRAVKEAVLCLCLFSLCPSKVSSEVPGQHVMGCKQNDVTELT